MMFLRHISALAYYNAGVVVVISKVVFYNAGTVKIYNAKSSLVRFENKIIFFFHEKTL
jgi:hypothetical protein